ncbi:hypothetical protein ABBQ38_002404 [Trebouxia sp. C0009 RCD-2024]
MVVGCRTRAKQEADAAAELQKDLARIEELTVEIRKCSLRKDMLGYDRHWSRYWLLEGSCSEAVAPDESPASCWVYVETCHCPPGEKRQHRESPGDEEEDLPLGQLAQQAQHDGETHQRAKRRKIQIPDDQGEAVSWGLRESHLQKALVRVRPKLPTASSLAVAAAAAAAVAAAAAEQASRKLLEDALPKAASTASLPAVARPESSHEPQPPAEDPAMTEPSSGAAPSSGAPATALEPPSAVTVPDAMDTDAAPVAQAPDSEAEPERDEPDKAEEAEQTPALDKQAAVQLPVSDLDRCRLDIGAVASSLPPEAFEPVSGSETRQHQWQLMLASAMRPQELMAATLLLESMLRGERFKPHWRICNMPAPSPSNAGSFAAVNMRLQALKAGIKKTVSGTAGASAVTREAAKDAAAHPHGGGGYSFRRRKAAGALAEPSPDDSAAEEPAAAKPTRAGVKRGRSAAKHAGNDDVEDDEALARRLQEQEDALATRGRATRGALRVKHKPSQLAHKGSSREARHARGSASAAVRSSSRLKPQSGQGKQRPMTRGSAEVRTTRSRAQEETYSSSSEEDDEAGCDLEAEGSELESSPASSVRDPASQDMNGTQHNEEHQSASNSGSGQGRAALQQSKVSKEYKDSRLGVKHSSVSRGSVLGRGNSPTLNTKPVEGRRRLRKAS